MAIPAINMALIWPERSHGSTIRTGITIYLLCRAKQPKMELLMEQTEPVFALQLCALEVCGSAVSEWGNTRTVGGSLSGGNPGASWTVRSSLVRGLWVGEEVQNLEYTGREGFNWVLSIPEHREGEPVWLMQFTFPCLEDVAAEQTESEDKRISLDKWLVAEGLQKLPKGPSRNCVLPSSPSPQLPASWGSDTTFPCIQHNPTWGLQFAYSTNISTLCVFDKYMHGSAHIGKASIHKSFLGYREYHIWANLSGNSKTRA